MDLFDSKIKAVSRDWLKKIWSPLRSLEIVLITRGKGSIGPLNERYRGGRSRRLIWEEILMIEQVSLFGTWREIAKNAKETRRHKEHFPKPLHTPRTNFLDGRKNYFHRLTTIFSSVSHSPRSNFLCTLDFGSSPSRKRGDTRAKFDCESHPLLDSKGMGNERERERGKIDRRFVPTEISVEGRWSKHHDLLKAQTFSLSRGYSRRKGYAILSRIPSMGQPLSALSLRNVSRRGGNLSRGAIYFWLDGVLSGPAYPRNRYVPFARPLRFSLPL